MSAAHTVTPTEPRSGEMDERQSSLWEHGEAAACPTDDTDSTYSHLVHNHSGDKADGGGNARSPGNASDSDMYDTASDDEFDYERPVARGSSYDSLPRNSTAAQIAPPPPRRPRAAPPRRGAPGWDCTMLSKADALARLEGRPAGSFVIRASGKPHARAAISMIRPDGTQFHQHIVESGGKLMLKGGAGPGHKTLGAFVLHHTSPAQTGLPCPLTLAGEPTPRIAPVAALSAASPPSRRRAARCQLGASGVPAVTLPPALVLGDVTG